MNDPAFLLYSKDFLCSTSHMTPAEIGVYIRLLCFQHQNAHIPNVREKLMRIAGVLDGQQWDDIWASVGEKFVVNQQNQMVNQRLNAEKEKRAKYQPKKIASATLAGLISANNLDAATVKKIKQSFDLEAFTNENDKETIKNNIKEWFYNMVNHMVNNLGNANAIENENIGKGGEGGKGLDMVDDSLIDPVEISNPVDISKFNAFGLIRHDYRSRGLLMDNESQKAAKRLVDRIKAYLHTITGKNPHEIQPSEIFSFYEKMSRSESWHLQNNWSVITMDRKFTEIINHMNGRKNGHVAAADRYKNAKSVI